MFDQNTQIFFFLSLPVRGAVGDKRQGLWSSLLSLTYVDWRHQNILLNVHIPCGIEDPSSYPWGNLHDTIGFS